MDIELLSTVAVTAPDPPASRKLYVETPGLPLEGHGGDNYHSEQITGCKSLGDLAAIPGRRGVLRDGAVAGAAAGAAGQA